MPWEPIGLCPVWDPIGNPHDPVQLSTSPLWSQNRKMPVSESCARSTFSYELYDAHTGLKKFEKSCGFLLLGPPGFNCWFSFAPVFQWCCSTPQGSPGVGRNTFLSSPHLCFIIVFMCYLFASRDEIENLHADRTTVCFEPWQKLRAGWVPVKPV